MQEVLEKHNNKQKRNIVMDYNSDLAQGFGIYKNNKEFDFLDYVSSVNISAGFHAGDPVTIREALLKAKEKNVVIGANIGFNDIQGFGMHAMNLSEEEIEALVIYQVGALQSFAKAYSLEIEFVRPHGAMYNLAEENFEFSCSIAKAIKKCSKWLSYVGAASENLIKVGETIELPIVSEIELNKTYAKNGLIDRTVADITDYNVLSKKLYKLLQYKQIENIAGETMNLSVNTIHFATDDISLRLLKEANSMALGTPVNFARAQESGWV